MEKPRQYIAIDLKSFYASVECVERGLNALDTCLLVADKSRTDKTICLAVSPALKAFGIPGRPRLFEVIQLLRQVNRSRGRMGSSTSGSVLAANPGLQVDYIVAPPRMKLYVDYSTRIYEVYLRHIAPEDIHVYSIDEVFIDATNYLDTYRCDAHELATRMIRDVLKTTGITATAGIGTNMYLCKVAMDIVAKKMQPDADGVRIASLDERSYREKLWDHRPLTDFWRIGRGTARKLEQYGMYTMGDVARASLTRENWFYHEMGVNAELLIDHAWGWEPVTMDKVKAYRPATTSLSSGQVLTEPYTCNKARTVVQEMADELALDLVSKGLATDQVVLTIGYDSSNLTDERISAQYNGRVTTDWYGRPTPYHAHGTANLDGYTSSSQILVSEVAKLYDRIVNPLLLIRRVTINVNRLMPEHEVRRKNETRQLDLFTDNEKTLQQEQLKAQTLEREHRRQEAILALRKKYGKNTVLKGLNYREGATQRQRNKQIGGHNA